MAEKCLYFGIFVLVLLISDVLGLPCSCPSSHSTGCDVQLAIVQLNLKELLGPSCTRIAFPQAVANAKVATFNDKATCIKYHLSAVEGVCGQATLRQSSKLVSTGEYVEEHCDVKQLAYGVFEFNCPRIDTVYYEHINYYDGQNVITTTCVYVNGTFIDQMSVYVSTDRKVDESIIKQKFCDVGVKVETVEVLKQHKCDN